ncbi:hypothetical protein JCM8097_006644 [Rhodosporidiobolus ruineniae]
MLDRLPPEILDAILVLTYPPSPWPDKDDKDSERRQTLTSLSLKLETPLKAKVRTMRTSSYVALQGMLVVVPQFRTIELFSVEIWPEPTVHPLLLQPFNLVHLSLLSVSVSQQDDFDRLLQVNVFPNLSTLWVGNCDHRHALRGYIPSVSSDLAQQLDMLQISNHEYGMSGDEPPSASFWTLPTAVLVTHELFSARYLPTPLPILPFHVRVVVAPDFDAQSDTLVSEDLISLAACITPLISLKTLVLPSFLRRLDHLMPASVGKREELLKACTAKKVDVVWHEGEGELSFSTAFWAHAKRLKAKTALEADEAAAAASGSA